MCWDCIVRHAKDVDGELRKRRWNTAPGCIVCLDCPRDHHHPPYLPFWMPTHIRQHLRAHRRHRIVYWCIGDDRVEARIKPHWKGDIFPDLSVQLIDVVPPTEAGGVAHGSIMSSPCSEPQEAPMCIFRRVKVTWPDGRSIKLLVEEDGARPKRCNVCQMSEATFRQRDLVPHDDLEHQVLYHDATVSRGRRLSPEQAAAIRKVHVEGDPAGKPWQPAFPGLLVDPGAAL